jgi:hypothetical protein
MFSPTPFCDFFAANKLEVEKSNLVRYSPNPSAAWSVYQYRPREWDALQIGGLDGRPYLNFIVARKTADSINSEIPQQSVYAPTSAQYGGCLADTLRNQPPMRVVRRDGGRPRAECWSVYPVH